MAATAGMYSVHLHCPCLPDEAAAPPGARLAGSRSQPGEAGGPGSGHGPSSGSHTSSPEAVTVEVPGIDVTLVPPGRLQ